jgi:hypothetical protein
MTSNVTSGLREALDAALDESNNAAANSPVPDSVETAGSSGGSVDMGYEECQPSQRRGSMTHDEARERRASIKAIMADDKMTPFAKRKSIQYLMDGRRQSTSGASYASSTNSLDSSDEGDLSEDDETSLLARSEQKIAICNAGTKNAELQRAHCGHYDRKCTIISPCCGGVFGCRICHDDCPLLPPIINQRRSYKRSASLPSMFESQEVEYDNEDETHHTIDRFAIREVICRKCCTRQSSKTYVSNLGRACPLMSSNGTGFSHVVIVLVGNSTQ